MRIVLVNQLKRPSLDQTVFFISNAQAMLLLVSLWGMLGSPQLELSSWVLYKKCTFSRVNVINLSSFIKSHLPTVKTVTTDDSRLSLTFKFDVVFRTSLFVWSFSDVKYPCWFPAQSAFHQGWCYQTSAYWVSSSDDNLFPFFILHSSFIPNKFAYYKSQQTTLNWTPLHKDCFPQSFFTFIFFSTVLLINEKMHCSA